MTGHSEAYFGDFRGRPQELISALKHGFLFQGQRSRWQKKRRGAAALDLAPPQFITYLQNHDQIANTCRGQRLQQLTSPGRLRAMTALLLLAPGTPLLFQGQEFGASNHFYFFADHNPELKKLVHQGRIQFLSQFRNLAQPEMCDYHTAPGDLGTFECSKLDLSERQSHAAIYQLHKELLHLRRQDATIRQQQRGSLDGAVLAEEAFVIRYFGVDGDDRLLLVNLGANLHFDPAPEPLLAHPAGKNWELLWSSEDPKYGGCGTPPVESDENWRIPAHSAVVMRPVAEKA